MTDLQLRSLLKLAVIGAAASVALIGCGKKRSRQRPPPQQRHPRPRPSLSR